MNREVKFKVVWNGEVSLYGFTLGELIEGVELEFKDGGTLPFKDIDWLEDKVVYMQYTGLKDKNGVEIYEGNVVRSAGNLPTTVIWEKDGWTVNDCWISYQDEPGRAFSENEDWEVIGNIWEHPELLN